ncbi:Uncharacterised protein [uncultured archaeon]|nr:Uncharacterised protein [uncultured archaeon]
MGKKETNYVDGKPHVTEKESKVSPEEKEIYKDLINEIKKGNKIYWKAIKTAVKYIALYIPIPI